MGAETTIEWCDKTFNPWAGCTKISPACDHCYAESWATRFGMVEWGGERKRTSAANWNLPLKWDREAGETKTRPRVFCASLADVFDNTVPPEWRRDLFSLIDMCRNLDWLLLTKRIGNARDMLNTCTLGFWDMSPWKHVWLGATICNQDEADRDIPKLLAVPAALHFVSIEPMLGPIDLGLMCVNWSDDIPMDPETGIQECCRSCDYTGLGNDIDWVISGGESGPAARHSHPDWFRSLRDQCAEAGVPYLHKQNGEWVSVSVVEGRGRHYTFPDSATVRRVGKRLAGRAIDGVVHDGFPALPA